MSQKSLTQNFFEKFLNSFISLVFNQPVMHSFQPPEEESVPLLPKNCYFKDGKTKIDYVLVFPNFSDNLRPEFSITLVNKFLNQLKSKGLILEQEIGKLYTTLQFVKINGPLKILVKFANIYNITLTCHNPYYKYEETIICKAMTTELTSPNPDSPIYKRAEKTLSGLRPTEITTLERSLIVQEIVSKTTFNHGGDEWNLKKLIDAEIFLQSYAIHDGTFRWTTEGPLSDRQLLFNFWANVKYMFREQPINLIEKYYGPKIGFYFALVSLYTKMLVIPTIIGMVTIFVGVYFLINDYGFLEEEVCNNNITLCSDQSLKTACGLMKLAFLIDNSGTIVYVILCSFWGVVFWSFWQRRQAMLRLRWNLTSLKADRTMRKEFQESARTRRSSITGETEYYISPVRKTLMTIFSYVIILILVFIFFVFVFLIIEYRFWLRKKLNYDKVQNGNEIELFTAAILTTVIILIIDMFFPLLLKIYSKIIRFLTLLRMPRTQSQYNRMYLHMTFIITFSNYFSSLFYLAYFKGFFHQFPGAIERNPIIERIQRDLCKPSGCLVDLGTQLVSIMVIKTLVKCAKDLFLHLAAKWTMKATLDPVTGQYGQWEKDYAKKDLNDSVMNELYLELVLQYSFITFFNASLPIIGLIALLHNMLKIQHDAYRFLKLFKRPVLKKVSDIEGWNNVLKAVTFFGCISNTFLVAFRTNFIQRVLYRKEHGSLHGYINSTLSKFLIDDFSDSSIIIDHSNKMYCYYKGLRYPPEHPRRYQLTETFWHHVAIRAIYFIILEKFTLLLSLILSYLLPDIPRKVKVKLEHDEKLLREAREKQMESEK